MVAFVAARLSASPPNVVKKKTSFSHSFITSARPVRALTGMPLATAFEKHARSARTPYRCCAPPSARRKPVHISSKTSKAPTLSQSARTPSRKPGFGASNTVGSRITQATESSSASSSDCRSLYLKVKTSSFVDSGMPALRSVTEMYQSCQPWYPQQSTLSRLVKARARRTAALVASQPVFEKRTFSAPGTTSRSSSATSTSSGCMREKVMPSSSWARMAASTAGYA
jgi:hypothetical protein